MLIGSSVVTAVAGEPIHDDLRDLLAELVLADPIALSPAREAPREFTGPAPGNDARWFRADGAPGAPYAVGTSPTQGNARLTTHHE